MPFHFDKQVLFMETVYSLFGTDTIPAGLLNFSDWQAAEAATSTSSACAALLTVYDCDTSLRDVLFSSVIAQYRSIISGGAVESCRGCTQQFVQTLRPTPTITCDTCVPAAHLFLSNSIGVALCSSSSHARRDLCVWIGSSEHSSSACRALQAQGIDTIEVDVWVTLIPPNGYLAPTLWNTLLAPDPRLAAQTGTYGVPINITSLVSATNYLVRASSLACTRFLVFRHRSDPAL